MEALHRLLTGRDDSVTLDVACLELARVEFPGLEPEPFLEILDSHARELDQLAGAEADGLHWVRTANDYLFVQLGFRGNHKDYYSAPNSCLNEVLASRCGIPITLSVVVLEIARRVDRPVYGIGLPGHFLVRYDDGEFDTFLDPFHGGRVLDAGDCRRLALEAAGIDIASIPAAVEPVSDWDIVMRMLRNLRGVYARTRDYPKLVQVLELLLAGDPESSEDRHLKEQLERYLRTQG